MTVVEAPVVSAGPVAAPGRLDSLDALRGAIVAAMIIVNDPGDVAHVYGPWAHVPWNGLAFADVIAPCFLWVIGVTTALSLARRRAAATSVRSLLPPIVRRSVILYAFGLLLSALPLLFAPSAADWGTLKVMGILQRIAICYGLGAAVYLVAGPRARLAIALVLVAGTWAFVAAAAGAGYPLEPGRNLVQVLDGRLLGAHAESSSHALLTILPATATVLFGTLAGAWLLSSNPARKKATGLVLAGLAVIVAGLVLSPWIPVNRRLWSPSFNLVTTGLSMAAYGACYAAVEIARLRRGLGWLMAFGANPFFLFVLSGAGWSVLAAKGLTDSAGTWRSLWHVADDLVCRIAEPTLASFLVAVIYTAAFGVLALVMYRRRWFIKV